MITPRDDAKDAGWTQTTRAVLFDVDGTLYHQPPLRGLMLAELGMSALRHSPRRMRRVVNVLRTFRRVREELRALNDEHGRLCDEQFARAALRSGASVDEVQAVVSEWILRRPLKYMRAVKRTGVQELLALLAARRVRIGALSDYPVDAKLRALDIAEHFSCALCTTDSAINAFKPHPQGFRRACELWGVSPQEVLYVGDRPEVDAAGAEAAGVQCVIIGRRHGNGSGRGRSYSVAPSFRHLVKAFAAAH